MRDAPAPSRAPLPARHAAAQRHGRAFLLQAAVVLLVAATIAFWRIDQANIGPDELVYQGSGVRFAEGDLTANPEHPPLAKAILGAWQLWLGPGIVSARALMGVVLVATALVGFVWIRAAFGPIAGVLAAIMLSTTHRVSSADFIDRQVLLDPFSVLFGLSGLALLWHWQRHRRVATAVLAGALLALAILSKASAVLLLLAALACVPWREVGKREVWGAMLAVAVTGTTACLLAYAPLGGLDAVEAMIAFQSEHAEKGHRITVAGVTHVHAPWYALLWFAGEVVGWPAFLAVVAFGAAAIVLRWRERATRVLAVAGGGSLAVMSASPVALPHYTWGWLWALLLLSGVGLAEVWRRSRTAMARLGAAAGTALLLVGPATGMLHVLTIAPTGVARVDAAMLADPSPDGTVLTLQLSALVAEPNIDAPLSRDPAGDGITAVAIGQDERYPAPPELVEALASVEEPVVLDELVLYLLDEELDELLVSPGADAP